MSRVFGRENNNNSLRALKLEMKAFYMPHAKRRLVYVQHILKRSDISDVAG